MSNMFSKSAIAGAITEGKERKKKLSQELIPKGFNLLKLKEVEYTQTKSKQDPMFVLTFIKARDKEEKYKPFSEYIAISEDGLKNKTGQNVNAMQLMAFFFNAFSYTIQEPDSEDEYGDLLKQFKKFEGKEFRTILIWEKRLNMKQTSAMNGIKMWWDRVTTINDTKLKEDTVDAKSCQLELSGADKAILRGEGSPSANKRNTEKDAPDITDEGEVSELPF